VIKNNTKQRLGKKNIRTITGNAIYDEENLNVLAEYENAFNGIAIDINDKEAKKFWVTYDIFY